jgi:hypothetical protein
MTLSRRGFLVASGAALTLAACGGDDGGDASTSAEGLALLTAFPPTINAAGVAARMPISIVTAAQGQILRDTPATLPLAIVTVDGAEVATYDVGRRDVDVPLPYYPVRHTFDAAGTYLLRFDVDGRIAEGAISILDAAEVTVPKPGDAMVAVDTPTVIDARGVDPICTREPPCPLHDVTLADALAEGRPIAFLVGTPAYCQTGVCGPILENLLAERERLGGDASIRFLHAEIYTRAYEDDSTPVTDAVLAYTQLYEPAIFLADATGTIVERVDVTVDRSELAELLDALVA